MKILGRLLKFPSRYIRRLMYIRKFGTFGQHSDILSPLRIDGAENICIGRDVIIQYHTWIAAVPLTNMGSKLIIKDGCTIGNFNHIYATGEVILEKDVLTADRVYISDNLHGYEDITIPIHKQPIKQNNHVTIGEGSWLGENVCVVGASIGKHCVIGANSVVTKDIPDYSVAVGIPARVIKQYDFNEKKWVKCE